MERDDIRLAVPSKGALQKGTETFLKDCGLNMVRPNPRQYAATIPALPGVTIILQRPGDIVAGVLAGTLDFGITGLDIVSEMAYGRIGSDILVLHDELGIGPCQLMLAVPNELPVHTMPELATWASELAENGRFLRVATKFPNLTQQFLTQHAVSPFELTSVEGTLEIAPALGYADIIADLVSTGITLRDNHLRPLADGEILASQACLIANVNTLRNKPEALEVARKLLEYMEAHLRATNSYVITANMRGDSPEAIADLMFNRPYISGLQGPTVSPVVASRHLPSHENWYAVNIVVNQRDLVPAIAELRQIGGSGVIVSPCIYIFEEEPARYTAMLEMLNTHTERG